MKHTTYLSLALAALTGLTACNSESPFQPEPQGTGRVLTTGLGVEVKGEDALTRAGASLPAVDDFTVDFINAQGATVQSYKYGSLPEIVTLQAGDYSVHAYYGTNPPAAFNAPYYKGASASFTVAAGQVTEIKDPVVCSLANVRVTVNFDVSLASKMGPDAKVTAHMGQSGTSLEYTLDTDESGYFAYVEQSNTLTAVFSGTVEGAEMVETRTYADVKPGNHYKITFKLKNPTPGEPGYTEWPDNTIKIDAEVEVNDLTDGTGGGNLEPGEENLTPDDRPDEEPDDPTPPGPGKDTPVITGRDGIQLDTPMDVYDGMQCVVDITSSAEGGFTEFFVTIDSDTLTEDVLTDVGLATRFSLVTPSQYADGLSGLGFPIGDQVKGKKEVTFDITTFMPLLGVYGAGRHNFILEVSDANGTTKSSLILITK